MRAEASVLIDGGGDHGGLAASPALHRPDLLAKAHDVPLGPPIDHPDAEGLGDVEAVGGAACVSAGDLDSGPLEIWNIVDAAIPGNLETRHGVRVVPDHPLQQRRGFV